MSRKLITNTFVSLYVMQARAALTRIHLMASSWVDGR
jgi:hypothetical protein